jgi:peroxiredoxin
MLRTTIASLLLLPALALPCLAQGDFKPPPGPAPKPAPDPTPPPATGGPGRGRVSERVAIGERAPDFELFATDGRTVRLSRMRGEWIMLVFVERRDSLRSVEPMARALSSIGVRTVTVCFDKPQALARFLAGRDPGYLALADPTGDITALYGLLDPLRDEGQPGFVLVTPRGDVRLALLGVALPREDASRLVQFAVTGE